RARAEAQRLDRVMVEERRLQSPPSLRRRASLPRRLAPARNEAPSAPRERPPADLVRPVLRLRQVRVAAQPQAQRARASGERWLRSARVVAGAGEKQTAPGPPKGPPAQPPSPPVSPARRAGGAPQICATPPPLSSPARPPH